MKKLLTLSLLLCSMLAFAETYDFKKISDTEVDIKTEKYGTLNLYNVKQVFTSKDGKTVYYKGRDAELNIDFTYSLNGNNVLVVEMAGVNKY